MRKSFLFILSLLLMTSLSTAQTEESYEFTKTIDLPAGPVQNQYRTGTCWSFATISFIESEMIRLDKGTHQLSEMYMVRYVYPEKARRYVRRHGNLNFGQGSLSHDVMKVIADHGMVPESIYDGLNYGMDTHNHGELATVLNGMLDGVLSRRSGQLTTAWLNACESVLDTYLGEVPEFFEYEGQTYTPQSFAVEMGIDPDNYVELTSFTHHPYYEQFVLEVPDNWADALYYNLPLDELMEVMNYSLENGYTIAWDGDVSERGFSHRDALAVLPATPWAEMSDQERNDLFKFPHEEQMVTPELRQQHFNNFSTTDDHLMHITGMATDQNGTAYYLTKNSYGAEGNDMDGYLYMSAPYVQKKTIGIMVHKDAIPADIREKIEL